MIGCLHVGQLDNLGLQLEHTGWPERHWVEMEISQEVRTQTLPKALRTQALTTLTSNFGEVILVGLGMFGLVGLVW